MEFARVAVVVVVAAAAGACHASAIDRGRAAGRVGDWDAALPYYEQALAAEPSNVEYRIALERARLNASRAYLAEARARVVAGDLEGGIGKFEVALGYDPTNRYAHEELEALRMRLAREQAPAASARVWRVTPFVDGDPKLDPSSHERLHVNFPDGSSLRTVLESLATLAGVSILFDESFRDQRVSVDLDQVTYREALDILMQTNGLFYKVVPSTSPLPPPDER